MSVFARYARCYDLLYRDKDYAAEARFVDRLIQTHAPGARSILDLGCGTGAHAAALAGAGYRVHGVDRSPEMLGRSRERLARLPADASANLSFSEGDIRSVRLGETFDAVVALFHVVSYQTGDEDLRGCLAAAGAHLGKRGIFLFDCWYGPAVLHERPSVKVKRLEDDGLAVTRIAEPVMRPNENAVDVRYRVFARDKGTGAIEEFEETHRMRYLFKPEVETLFRDLRLAPVDCREWMTGREPGLSTWNVYFVARETG